MYSPLAIGACLLIAAVCLEVGENDSSKKQIVSQLTTRKASSHPQILYVANKTLLL